MQAPSVEDSISILFEGQGQPKKQPRQKQSYRKQSLEEKKAQAGRRYYIKRALVSRLGPKYNGLYQCPICFKRKKLRLYRIRKNHRPPKFEDYLLLCQDCIKKKQEESKKTKLWSRKPGPRGGSPGNSKITFLNSIRALVFERDSYKCVWCGAREKLRIGPLIPESRGGKLCLDNYVTTCEKCLPAKGRKLPLNYIWERETLKYFSGEDLDDIHVHNPGTGARVNLYLIAEINQFLQRLLTNGDLPLEIRGKAERLSLKLSEDEKEKARKRKAEVPW